MCCTPAQVSRASRTLRRSPAEARETFAKALARVEVNPAFPPDLAPALQKDAEVLLREKKISAIPDWKKALRPEFWAKASG